MKCFVKALIIFAIMVALIVLFFIGFFKWHNYPVNIISEVAEVKIPFFSKIVYHEYHENILDAYGFSILEVSPEYMDEIQKTCAEKGFRWSTLYPTVEATLKDSINKSESELGLRASKACWKAVDREGYYWELIIDNGYAIFRHTTHRLAR